MEMYEQALLILEQISFIDRLLNKSSSISTLLKQCELYELVDKDNTLFKKLLDEKRKKQDVQKLAYSQVNRWLELCELENPDMVKKIPRGFRDFLETNSTINVEINPRIPIKNQIGEEGLAIIALIVTNYWKEEYPNHSSIYNQNEKEHRLLKWKQLKIRMSNTDLVSGEIGNNNHKLFNEVYWILEHLPDDIICLLPINLLVWVKNNRVSEYDCDLEHIAVQDLSDETIELLKRVLDTAKIPWNND